MSLEQDIYERLIDHTGLAALVSERVYPAPLPQGATLPAVTYARISTAPTYSQKGDSLFDQVRMQLDCWSDTHAGVIALAAQVRAALAGRLWPLGVCFLDADRDVYEPETGYRRRILDILIWHEE